MYRYQPTSRFAQVFDKFEEICIAACLGIMTLITFSNVVARYLFNSNILWALEVTVMLFAWLVLMGASYGVKHHTHIGVDVILEMASPKVRKLLGLISVGACLAFSILLLIGSWDYWYAFITKRAFMETEDIPMPDMLRFLEGWINQGEAYEKLPRFIPYLALPLGMALLTYRFLQAGWSILNGKTDKIITSHEVEEELEAAIAESSQSESDSQRGNN
jgi:C4-dicarboxylate transporter DctQ subunit